MTYQEVLDLIQAEITANGNNEITGNVLRPILEAILLQPNELIGNIEDLQTNETSDLVSAINSLLSELQSNNGLIEPYKIDLGYGIVESTEEDNTTMSEILAYINLTGFEVPQSKLVLLSFLVKKTIDGSIYIYRNQYYFRRTGTVGLWGSGTINGLVLRPDLIEDYETLFGVTTSTGTLTFYQGDIGTLSIKDYANTFSGTLSGVTANILPSDGRSFYFAVTRNGNDELYRYVGGLPVQIGTDATVNTDFDLVAITGEGSSASVDGNLQGLQSVLDTDGYAESPDGQSYIEMAVGDNGTSYVDMFNNDGNIITNFYFNEDTFKISRANATTDIEESFILSVDGLEIIKRFLSTGGGYTSFSVETPNAVLSSIKIPAPSQSNDYVVQVISDNSPPSSNTDTGGKGEVRYDGSFKYECIDTDTWIRIPITTTF